MKRLLLLLSIIATGVLWAIPSSANTAVYYASGATGYPEGDLSYEITNGSSSNIVDVELTTDACTLSFGSASTSTMVNGSQVRWYTNSTLTITPGANVTISQIDFACTSASYAKASISCSDGKLSYDGTTKTWTGSQTEAFTIKAGAQIRFSYIVVTYSVASSSQQSAGLSYSASSATAEVGKDFDAPTLSNPNNLAVTYASSNTDVAEIDDAGVVTIKAQGITTISAHSDATESFLEGKASYTLTVTDPNIHWSLVKDASVLAAGDKLIVANQSYKFAASTATSKNNRAQTAVSFNDDNSQILVPGDDVMIFELGGKEGAWTFKTTNYTSDNGYLNASSSSSNYAIISVVADGNEIPTTCQATISINASNEAVVTFNQDGHNILRYNNSSNCFSCYTSGQNAVCLYRYVYGNEPASPELSFAESTVTTSTNGEVPANELSNPNNLEVTYSSSNTDVATVDAETGVVTLVADAYGETTITALFAGNDEYSKGSANYTLIVNTTAGSIADFKTKGAASSQMQMTVEFPVTVGYFGDGKGRLFVTDGTDWIMIFKSGLSGYNRGDVIPAGWTATFTNYYNVTPEMMPVGDIATVTETADVTFETVLASDITVADVNKVYTLKNITFTEATKDTSTAFTGTYGESGTVSLSNYYTIASVEAGVYDVDVVVAVSTSGAVILNPIEYRAVPTVESAEFAFGVTDDGELNTLGLELTVSDNATREDGVVYALYQDGVKVGEANGLTISAANLKPEQDSKFELVVTEGEAATTYEISLDVPAVAVTFAVDDANNYLSYNIDGKTTDVEAYACFTAEANISVFEVSGQDGVEVVANDEAKCYYVKVAKYFEDVTVENKAVNLSEMDYTPVTYKLGYSYQFACATAEGLATEEYSVADDTEYTNTFSADTKQTAVTGIADVMVDADGAAEYYNLQGVRVDGTIPGLYIRRQGSVVSKVIVK